MNKAAERVACRYAVYFSPASGSPWWRFGARWLGRGEPQRDAPPGLGANDWFRMTEEPRRYDFHATLKAPFRLAESVCLEALQTRLQRLAGSLGAVPLGEMLPQRFSGYVALSPALQSPALLAFAERCVSELDDLRAPLLEHELARRQPDRLDDRGRALLLRYGYPHVMERFRFHMTLATCADEAAASAVIETAGQAIAPLNREHPLVLDRLCLFEERGPGESLSRVADFPLLS